MTQDEIRATAEARYQVFRELLPKVYADVEGLFTANGTKVGWDIRSNLMVAATEAAARLASGNAEPPRP